jgi:hypothetical protein
VTALRLAFTNKIYPFEIGGQTNNIERVNRGFEQSRNYKRFSHAQSPVKVCAVVS